MKWIFYNCVLSTFLIIQLHGCAVISAAKTSRYAFYPPVSSLIESEHHKQEPIAQHASFTWQTVRQELSPGIKPQEQTNIISTIPAPSIKSMVNQSQQLADDASEKRRIHSRLANEAKTLGDAQYHHSMARFHAEEAYVKQQMVSFTKQIDSSISIINNTVGIYNSLASAGKQMGDLNYAQITKNITTDLNLLGKDAPEGSSLHFEYHYGLEPSTGKKFNAAMSVMLGSNAESNNEFMVTAVLTQANGKQITATRLLKMIWYTGDDNVKRPFPKGYEEYKPYNIPNPEAVTANMLNYQLLNQLALAVVDDIRLKLRKSK